jgi:hypothetical protein
MVVCGEEINDCRYGCCQEEKLKDVLREYFPKNLCNADKTTF